MATFIHEESHRTKGPWDNEGKYWDKKNIVLKIDRSCEVKWVSIFKRIAVSQNQFTSESSGF